MNFRHPGRAVKRRQVLVSTGAIILGAAGPETAHAVATDRQVVFSTLVQAMQEVKALAGVRSLNSSTEWTFAQTLVHAAQSIEYSMTGFPQPKSSLFQHTVGAAAFAVFDLRGRMSHGLAEPIPGAPALDAATETYQALERLEIAVARFHAWSSALKPHFAYGELSKPAYERAHAMHLANHLSAFSADSVS